MKECKGEISTCGNKSRFDCSWGPIGVERLYIGGDAGGVWTRHGSSRHEIVSDVTVIPLSSRY